MEVRTVDEFGKLVIPRQLRIKYGLATINSTIKSLVVSDRILYLYSAREVFKSVPDGFKYKELNLDDLGRLNVMSVFGTCKKVLFDIVTNNDDPNNDDLDKLEYIQLSVID